jgi:hypothetical protein
VWFGYFCGVHRAVGFFSSVANFMFIILPLILFGVKGSWGPARRAPTAFPPPKQNL